MTSLSSQREQIINLGALNNALARGDLLGDDAAFATQLRYKAQSQFTAEDWQRIAEIAASIRDANRQRNRWK